MEWGLISLWGLPFVLTILLPAPPCLIFDHTLDFHPEHEAVADILAIAALLQGHGCLQAHDLQDLGQDLLEEVQREFEERERASKSEEHGIEVFHMFT